MFQLDKITDVMKNVQALAKNLPLDQIFTSEFMASNTKFKTIEEFLSKVGIDARSLIGAADSKDAKLNRFVSENSKFGNWKEMYESAISMLKK